MKTLNKDYDLWKLHQEKLLAHPGAIDMSQYGPQIGENGTTPENETPPNKGGGSLTDDDY